MDDAGKRAAERINQVASGFMEAKILLAAAELSLFEALRGSGATAAAVARTIGGTTRGAEILLDALTSIGFVVKKDGVYRNHPDYEPLLVEDSPSHMTASLRHRNRLFQRWAFLEEIVRRRPLPERLTDRANLDDPRQNENFIRAMYAVSHRSAPAVVDHVPLLGVERIADLGGGPGHYLAEFGRRAPGAELYLIDLPLTIEVARRIQAETPEGSRIRYVVWDFYNEPTPRTLPAFDLIFVSQVVHSSSAEENKALLARLFPLTTPGGAVVVHERTILEDRTSPREAAIFAVNMLAMTPAGRTYTAAEISSWGEAAGFVAEPGKRINEVSELIRLVRPA